MALTRYATQLIQRGVRKISASGTMESPFSPSAEVPWQGSKGLSRKLPRRFVRLEYAKYESTGKALLMLLTTIALYLRAAEIKNVKLSRAGAPARIAHNSVYSRANTLACLSSQFLFFPEVLPTHEHLYFGPPQCAQYFSSV